MTISPPQPLSERHGVSQFASGKPSLDDWLKKRALANQRSDATRIYVICDGAAVIGYYAIATASIAHADALSRVKRNMPDPIPMAVIARLAVDLRCQSKGIGAGLLKDALLRIVQAADQIGIKGVLADALHEKLCSFYERFGFRPSPSLPLRLIVTVADLRNSLGLTQPLSV